MSSLSNVLLGTAVGAALGILFAPDEGKKTREKLLAQANEAKDKLAESAGEVKDKVATTYGTKKETFDDQLENVVSNLSYKADDIISSLEKKLSDLKAKNKRYQKETTEPIVNGETVITDEPLTA
jgi:gas vesicle protein